MLKSNYTAAQKASIEEKIGKYENVKATGFFSKEEYAGEIGADPNTIELYDAIVVSFTSMDSIGTYVQELSKLDGVHKAEQSYAKNDLELFHIQKWGKYTYANSDEALDEDLNAYYYNNYVTVWRKRFVQGHTPRVCITGTMWSPTDFMVKIIELLTRENKFVKWYT